MSFWTDHGDKVVTVVGGSIIAGLVGFFSGIAAVQSDISSLRERAASLESEVSNLKPLNKTVHENSKKIISIESDNKDLQKRNDISSEVRQILVLRSDEAKKETIRELRELIKEAKK